MCMKKTALALIAFLLAFLTLSACGPADNRPVLEMTDEEARETLKPLIEAAYEINEIFFGKGLPYEGEPNRDLNTVSTDYLPVSDESPYRTIEEIKTAAEKVYTVKYLEPVYSIIFEGLTVDTSTPDYLGESVAPRYKLFGDVLKVNALYEGYTLKTKPDASTAHITERTPDYIRVSLDYTADGVKGTMSLTLAKNEDGYWRLDSPSY